MANTDAFALQKSNLNGFLFADVGVEASGNNLSVLSALARMGVDPWQEGGRLSKLPRLAAIEALARSIAIMPSSPWSYQDATTIATRLVVLLPGAAKALVGSGSNRDRLQILETNGQWAVLFAILVTMFAGLALNLASGQTGGKDSSSASHAAAIQPTETTAAPIIVGQTQGY